MADKSYPFESVSGLVWHYTDAGGLLGMLKNNEVWASSYLHLNDGAEVATGVAVVDLELEKAELDAREREFVSRQIQEAKDSLLNAETFILSASTDGDSLSQWRGYAGGSGFAVGMDAAEHLDLLGRYELQVSEEQAEDPGFEGDVWQYVSPWRRVLYDADEQAERARALIEDFRKLSPPEGKRPTPPGTIGWNDVLARTMHDSEGYAGEVVLMKDGGFVDEREVRMYATMEDVKRFQETRATRFGLTPYVRLTGATYAEQVRRVSFASTKRKRLPIREVRIGPTPHVEAARSGLVAAFRQFAYEDVDISVSAVPYR